MRIPRYHAICTAIVALAILLNAFEAVVSAITTTVPSIDVRAPKGTPVRLTDFRGKVMINVLFDARLRAFEAFGAEGVAATYLIDRRGRIRHAHDDGDDSQAVYRAELDALLAEP